MIKSSLIFIVQIKNEFIFTHLTLKKKNTILFYINNART